MLKLIFFLLGALAVPAVTWWLENRDPDRWEAARMADRDRRAQARKAPHRRLKYSQVIKPPLLAQRRQPKGQM